MRIFLICLITTVLFLVCMVATVNADGLFPNQPVQMHPGYGSDGAGLHMAVPSGTPGPDCVVNPFDWPARDNQQTHVETKTITKVIPGDTFTLDSDVLFAFDKDLLTDRGRAALDHLQLNKLKVLQVTITGHTDAKGTDEYNYNLGLRRAVSVMQYLKQVFGISIVYQPQSKGESVPLEPNEINGVDNPDGRAVNRRVDITVDKAEVIETVNADVSSNVVVKGERNPQVFHVLSAGNTVYCGNGDYPLLNGRVLLPGSIY